MSGIELDKVPVTSDPDHCDVKASLFMYSMESFLFRRINQISRDKDTSAILTLGPYSVVLSRIISEAQRKRKNKITGPFKVYRGIALKPETIQ